MFGLIFFKTNLVCFLLNKIQNILLYLLQGTIYFFKVHHLIKQEGPFKHCRT